MTLVLVPAGRLNVGSDKSRVKFAVKLLKALERTSTDPELIPQVGIAWCSDGRHFIANPRILGGYLGLKPNSINANFRDHGFTICDCPVNQIIANFGNIPDPQNWRKRFHAEGEFTRTSTLEDANRISICGHRMMDLVAPPEPNTPVEDAQSIQNVFSLIFSGDRRLLTSVSLIIHKADGDKRWKDQMVSRLLSDWVTAFGYVCSVPMAALLDSILQPPQSLPHDMFRQLRTNVEDLLLSRDDVLSQKTDCVEFDDYLLLMFRYGPQQCLATTVCDLTCPDPALPFVDLSLGSFSSQSEGVTPSFHHWFHPGLNMKTAEALLRNCTQTAWVVRPSSVPNKFTVHCKLLGRLIASHIRYDGLEAEERFSIVLDNDEVKYAASLSQLLFDVLELRPEDAVFSPVEPTASAPRQTCWVSGREVISGGREDFLMSLDPMAFAQSD
jgi:hypothetical protein